eukprot:TRINITY_DN17650_c0_g1_i1.p1 TRINITY_DN17650_c0_g1~~TRINITY_DN17650_c0_g1_i1.p1  ORF type:complete len:119 (-),score=25.96 TRINITY_DN17650_c0_g1_i1:65-421(-)
MAPTELIRQLKIKTGVLTRSHKEAIMYEKEADQQRDHIQKMKDDGKDEYEIKKQNEVLDETLTMIPDCSRRINTAIEDLSTLLEEDSDGIDMESPEATNAMKALEGGRAYLAELGQNA